MLCLENGAPLTARPEVAANSRVPHLADAAPRRAARAKKAKASRTNTNAVWSGQGNDTGSENVTAVRAANASDGNGGANRRKIR